MSAQCSTCPDHAPPRFRALRRQLSCHPKLFAREVPRDQPPPRKARPSPDAPFSLRNIASMRLRCPPPTPCAFNVSTTCPSTKRPTPCGHKRMPNTPTMSDRSQQQGLGQIARQQCLACCTPASRIKFAIRRTENEKSIPESHPGQCARRCGHGQSRPRTSTRIARWTLTTAAGKLAVGHCLFNRFHQSRPTIHRMQKLKISITGAGFAGLAAADPAGPRRTSGARVRAL